MKDYYLINRQSGFVIPELYHMETLCGNITFIFPHSAWQKMSKFFITQMKDKTLKHMQPSTRKAWGKEEIFPPLHKSEKGYTFTISIEAQINNRLRRHVCESLNILLWMLRMYSHESKILAEQQANKQLQLFSIETVYSEKIDYNAGALAMSISPLATHFLVMHSEESIPNVHQAMKTHHNAKNLEDQVSDRNELFGALTGVIREKGTLRYVTFGNCACFGAMPENRKEDRGYDIQSHNVDTTWQQLSMVVACAATWQWVRSSLKYE